MHSGLSVDELEVGKKFKDKFECINAVKRRYIKIHCSIRPIIQLKLINAEQYQDKTNIH
jgi:hypothetical protein